MEMKKRIFLSMILLALCLIQASADNYYYKILLSPDYVRWSNYIEVTAEEKHDGEKKYYVYHNGLRDLINGKTVTAEDGTEYTLPLKDLDKWGIAFANGKGRGKGEQSNIMEGDEYKAWTEIRSHIKYLSLRDYKLDTYTNSGYFMDMSNVVELELPKGGMTVGNGDKDCEYYFANAWNLKRIYIWSGDDETGYRKDINMVKDKKLLNRVGEFMFANCWELSPKYIKRLLKDVEEIKRNGLNIQVNDEYLEIGPEAFKNCDKLAKISLTQDNKELRIYDNAFRGCKQLNVFENMDKTKITHLGEGVFRDCRSVTNEFVNGVLKNYANNKGTEIPAYLFSGCNGQDGYVCSFTELNIPASVTKIDKGAFADNPNVTKIIVNSGTQIDAQTYDSNDGKDGIFYGMDPNKVQVEFQGEADNNYKVYRENIKVGGEDKGKNAFMNLLTKTLNENDDDYTVVAQRHADVRLTRTFKEGWNTLVLPFGARHGEGREDGAGDCSRIFQKALNASNDGNFMIAAYRGLAKNEAQPDNSTFYFLKYANYDKDPLDEFEPLLVRMTQKDINDANGVYTFKDVELNYDVDNKTSYTAEDAKKRMGLRDTGGFFDGSYDHEANDKFKKCSYDDFYFTGTLYKQQGTVSENSAFIAPGDYIIQNNTFVKCLAGKKYGLKGFRGYFKQKPASSSHAKGNIGISLVDRNGVVSSIHQVDGASLTSASVTPVAVYNLSGQKVGNSLSTLAKGVYIVNGKKFVKK